MITPKPDDPHKPKLLKDTIGRKAKLTKPIRTGQMRIPAGTVVAVKKAPSWDKLEVEGAGCTHCGISAVIKGLAASDLEFLPKEK